jgi:uncharacterized damage-inducible protein DinB
MARSACPMCRTPHHRLGRRNVLGALAAAPGTIARAVGRARGRTLARRPARGEWSVVEVLAHLLDGEVTVGFRIRKIAAEPGTAVVAWDQEKWTERLRHRRADARQVLDAYAALRAANVAQARRLAPAARRLRGRHPEYGPISIAQVLEHFAEHDLNHLEQIRATLRSLASR